MILGLVFRCMLKQLLEEIIFFYVFSNGEMYIYLWFLILVNIEFYEMRYVDFNEEEDKDFEKEKFLVFRKLIGMMV